MHKRNVNIPGLTAGVKDAAAPFAPLTTWHELMPQTVISRRSLSRYDVYRWKLLPTLKEKS